MAKAYLNGAPLTSLESVGWSFTAGPRPYMRSFEMHESHVPGATNPPDDATLTFESSSGVKIEKLRIVSVMSGSMPMTRAVLVADRRWIWQRQHIARSYNVRRRTGQTANINNTTNPKIKHKIAYTEWSLNGGAPWTPREVLEDILKKIAPGEYDIDDFKISVDIEGLELYDSATYALNRVLRYMPGAKLWVNREGIIRVTSSIDQSEEQVFKDAGPVMMGTGYPVKMDNSFSRPSKINVLFTRVFELRFDYIEDDDEKQPLTVAKNPREEPRLENVVPLPDLTLKVPGRELTRGTYIEMSEFLAAIAGSQAQGLKDIDQATLRRHACMSFGWLARLYGKDSFLAPDLIWRQRIAAIRKSWRIMFRIRREWKDRIRSVRAYRAAVIDVETGTRAPSEAYMPYIMRPTYRTLAKVHHGEKTDAVYQVNGYADRLEAGQVAPASVRVIDEDNGILTVKLFTDAWGESDFLLPGSTSTVTTQSGGDLRALFHDITLDSGFKMAVVLSCIQASPNDETRLHHETVTPAQAQTFLGGDVEIGECNGPEWTIQIKASLDVARFKWDEDLKPAIHASFFDGETENALDDLMVNRDYIRDLAYAAAARIYGRLLDRVEGSMATGINHNVEPLGSIQTVTHSIGPDGAGSTMLSSPPELRGPELFAFLPQSTRRAIQRMVDL
jgi:hypothetical protein